MLNINLFFFLRKFVKNSSTILDFFPFQRILMSSETDPKIHMDSIFGNVKKLLTEKKLFTI